MTGKWILDAESRVPSSWDGYAERYSALLVAIGGRLPGGVAWRDDVDPPVPLDPADTARLHQLLLDRQLRNDVGEIMNGAGSNQWLLGERQLPQGDANLLLRGSWGHRDIPVFIGLEVNEPEGSSLWSYPDDVIAALIATVLQSIDATQVRVVERILDRLLGKADLPPAVGSHVYMTVPLDDPSRFPPGARQVRCGEGWLLIVPPGAGDEETLQRMRWVAAAIGAA